MLLPETTAEEALELAERLRRAVESASYGVAGPVTASFGVAGLAPEGTSAELLDAADRALYEAKQQGRNRAVLSGKSRHSLPT